LIEIPEALQSLYKSPGVVKYPDSILFKKSVEIESPSDYNDFVDEMISKMTQFRGIGMSAPQCGRSLRIIAIKPGGSSLVLYNPKIVSSTGMTKSREGCLSLPGLQVDVERSKFVKVKWIDQDGKRQAKKFRGLEAIVIQHEIDHLDGILITDKAIEGSLTWISH
jgi:peptide deformylase